VIDLHCHLLPGFDDGAQNLQTALMMARAAVDQGVGRRNLVSPCTSLQNWRLDFRN
jgi:tyrosine-protein phosphatase YwqE